jgi:hypothetical protein
MLKFLFGYRLLDHKLTNKLLILAVKKMHQGRTGKHANDGD